MSRAPLNYCFVFSSHSLSQIFYGLALVNASKYSISELRYLGMAQIITGLVAMVFTDYGLLFWAFGFGILHILYGISMYLKYEK